MKARYIIMAIGALGTTLGIGLPSSAAVMNAAATAPPGPASVVWDGSDYVGQVNGTYYYLGPNNTWMPLDAARQHQLEQWQQINPYWKHPTVQTGQIPTTRSHGSMRGQNVYLGNQTEQYPSWSNPAAHPSGIRNPRHTGHDM